MQLEEVLKNIKIINDYIKEDLLYYKIVLKNIDFETALLSGIGEEETGWVSVEYYIPGIEDPFETKLLVSDNFTREEIIQKIVNQIKILFIKVREM